VLPGLSIVWVIVFVLVFTVILDRLLLRPLTRVMTEREGAIRSARELAETSKAHAQSATDEFDAKTRAARAEVYRQMEEKRRAAMETRARIVAETRSEVERSIGEATTRIQAQATAARTQITRDADALATTIVERVLGRKAS
jgi:F-type H+-transporting ATPase subunit b